MTYGVVDLFCGVGGLTCGLEAAGLDVVAGYDLDASCEYTYTHNNNAVFVHKNIEQVTGKEIKVVYEGRRAGDPAELVASSDKAKRVLGWHPEYNDLGTIIATAWKWHSTHPQGFVK